MTTVYGHYGQHAARIRPDRICLIRLPGSISAPFCQRRHGSQCAKPTRIRSGWRGQGLVKRFWSESKLVCIKHRAWFLAGRNRPATSFPLSNSVAFFQRRHTVQNQPGSDLVLTDCVKFWPNGSGPEARRCARTIRPASARRFRTSPDPACLLVKIRDSRLLHYLIREIKTLTTSQYTITHIIFLKLKNLSKPKPVST